MKNQYEGEDSFEEDVEAPLNGRPRALSELPRSAISLFATSSVFLLFSMILFYVSVVHRPSEQLCAAKTSAYSPLMDTVRYSDYNFNNSFIHPSIYRGPPTNEIERNWERLWNHDLIAVPVEEFHRLNKSSEARYKMIPEDRGGGYAANIEVFHNLHCLSLIRQFSWFSYYGSHPERVDMPIDLTGGDVLVRIHVDHCIETLRLSIMCQGDVTPFLIVYDGPDDNLGDADFNANHKCRDFELIRDEAVKRAVVQRWPGGNRMWTKGEESVDPK